jgi:hypothetical protein
VFRLLVVAEGYAPAYSSGRVDPRAGPAGLKVKPHDLDRRDPALVFGGRVVDDDGKPVEGATVTSRCVQRGGSTQYGGLTGIDPLAVSDAKGEFRLGVARKGDALGVVVTARDLAPSCFGPQPAGAKAHEFKLGAGVTVAGRVLKDGKPLAGMPMGLIERTRNTDKFVGDFTISTDERGYFRFLHVPPKEAYALYGLMAGSRHGAIAVQEVRVEGHGTTRDVGAVEVQRGHRLAGRVVLADGKAVPEGTRLVLSREDAWDSQNVTLPKDGSFAFAGLPGELYSLSVTVKGYRPSLRNQSLDPLNKFRLIGKVRADVDGLRFLLEPGPPRGGNNAEGSAWQALAKEHIRLKDAPLQGAPAEAGAKGSK